MRAPHLVRIGVFVVGALCAAVPARDAAADPGAARAWAAAKDQLPATTGMVVGVDVAAVARSSVFGMMMPLVLSQQPDAKRGLELIKTTCKIDPLAAIEGVVVARDPDRGEGVVVASLGAGLDQTKLMKCFEDVAKASGSTKPLVAKKLGAVTELAMDQDRIYLSWLGPSVVAVPFDMRDRAKLERWIGQKGALAKAPVAKLLAAANQKGTVWGAGAGERELDTGIQMKGAHGAMTFAGGKLAIDLRIAMASPKAATDAVAKAQAQLAKLSSSGAPGVPPNVATMLKQVTVKAVGAEVAISASVPEGELLGLLTMMRP